MTWQGPFGGGQAGGKRGESLCASNLFYTIAMRMGTNGVGKLGGAEMLAQLAAAAERSCPEKGRANTQDTSMLLINRSPPGMFIAACWANCFV